jgi:urease accessory protein
LHSSLSHHALLALLRWVSPTLPVGAYAYSRGLEQAVHAGWVSDEASALAWILGVTRDGLTQLDAPVLARLHHAFSHADHDAVAYWNEQLAATRESRELALEDTQMGDALVRLLRSMAMLTAHDRVPEPCSYVTAFALACVRSSIGVRESVLGLLWACAESQTSAAVRLVPLGQTAGQRMVSALSQALPALVDTALSLRDDELGAALPALAIASALHETQYTRLFRS